MGGDTGGRLDPVSSGTRSTRTQTETTGCRCQALARAPGPHSDRQSWRPANPRTTASTNGDTRSAYAATVRSMRIAAPRFPWTPSSSKFRTVTEQCSRSPHGQFSMALAGALCLHENFRSVCPPVPRSAHAESAPNSGHLCARQVEGRRRHGLGRVDPDTSFDGVLLHLLDPAGVAVHRLGVTRLVDLARTRNSSPPPSG